MSEEESLKFATTPEYQAQVMAYMLSSPQFCDVASESLQGELFSNKVLQWFFNTIASSSVKLNSITLKEEMVRAVQQGRINEDVIDSYVEMYNVVKNKPYPATEDHIKKSIGEFIRTQNVRRCILESFDLIKEGDWDTITSNIQEAANSGFSLEAMGQSYFSEYENRLTRRMNQDEVTRLPTGIPELDEWTYGGLKNKQMGLIAGGTGRGKSIFLEWLGKVAIMLNQKVVYFTLELDEDSVAERYDAMFCRIKPQELMDKNDKALEKLSKMSHKYGDHLIIKEYPADGATVNDLKIFLHQLHAAGTVPDLVIVDYLDLLKPHRQYNDQNQEIDSISKALHGMAKSMNIKLWTATQLNRAGMAMETPDATGMAGYVGKIYIADIAIFMAQTNDEREDEIMRLIIEKSRNGPAGRTVKINTDYGFMTLYRPPPEVTPAEVKKEGDDGGSETTDGTESPGDTGSMQVL